VLDANEAEIMDFRLCLKVSGVVEKRILRVEGS